MKSSYLGFVALSTFTLLASSTVPPLPNYPKKTGVHTYGIWDVNLDYSVHRGRPIYRFLALPFVVFEDIQYAKPPTGNKRWQAPEWPEGNGELNLGGSLSKLPQWQVGWVPLAIPFVTKFLTNNLSDPELAKPKGPEDYEHPIVGGPDGDIDEGALTLDVFAHQSVWNNRANQKVKVLVWIYGGGYIFGHKNQHGDPWSFLDAAAKDGEKIIFVALNYRLGAYGWLGGKKFEEQGGVPNVGLLDQRLAIAWVKRYIERFGGDPSDITVMGQSAGASSILHHLTLSGGEENPPDFHKAILLSPGFFPQPNGKQDNDTFELFLEKAGATQLSDLYSDDPAVAAKISAANALLTYESGYGIFKFGPSIDGHYVPDLPGRLLAEGKFHPVPVLVGYTKLDGLLFTPPWIRTTKNLTDHVSTLFPSIEEHDGVLSLLESDYAITAETVKEQIIQSADFFDCNSHYLTKAIHEKDPEIPVYRFTFNTPLPLHGADCDYYYHPEKPALHNILFPVRAALAETMQTAVVNYVRTGAPGSLGQNNLAWPQYGDDKQVFNYGSPTSPLDFAVNIGESTLDDERCDNWQLAPYWYGLDSSNKAASKVQLAKQLNYKDYQYELKK